MALFEALTVLLPIVAVLSLVALLPLAIFSRFIWSNYEKTYDAFLVGLAGMLFLDLAYVAEAVVGVHVAYKGFELLSMLAFIGSMWLIVRNTASIYVVEEVNKRLEAEVQAKTVDLQSKIGELTGSRVAMINIMRDLEASRVDLENRIKDLTDSRTVIINMMSDLEAARKELQRAYDELKELDRMKSDIISNVSHELRTPITIAKGVIELAMEELAPEERKDLLARGKGALVRLNQVVSELVSAAGMGRTRMSKGEVSIGEVIEDVVGEVSPLAQERKITIEAKVEGSPVVEGDPDALRKVVYALVDNAVKFNKEGGAVKVAAGAEDQRAWLSVEDTGIGIPREESEKIFQPLYQVDATPTRKYPGIGMGLTIARDIVIAHKGRINVESEVGKGSKFTVALPTRQAG